MPSHLLAHPQIMPVRIDALKPHEHTMPSRLNELTRSVEEDRTQKRPIAVYPIDGGYLIIDGHHRAAALKSLGYSHIFATVIGFYREPPGTVTVGSWKSGKPPTKEEIIQRAHDGKLFDPQTTKHLVRLNGTSPLPFHHHKILAPHRDFRLDRLKRPSDIAPETVWLA